MLIFDIYVWECAMKYILKKRLNFVDSLLYFERVSMTANLKIAFLLLVFSVSLIAAEVSVEIPVILSDGGCVQGDIMSESGLPLAGAKVYFYSSDYMKIDSAICSIEGRYVKNLNSGKYYVAASKDEYCYCFYPHAYFISSAQAINVFPQQGQKIDLALQKGGGIRGDIIIGSSQTGDFLITAVKIDYPYTDWQQEKYFPVTGHGSYELLGLLPGYYKILIRSEGFHTLFYPQSMTFDDGEIVEIISNEIDDGVDFSPDRPGSGQAAGTIIDTDSMSPIAGAKVIAYQWLSEGDDPNMTSVFTNNRGVFDLELTEGYYYLMADVDDPFNPDQSIQLYYNNSYDADFAQAVYVESDDIVTDINFTLDFSQAYNLEISGNLSDRQSGRPLENADITAIDYYTGGAIAATRSSANGDFAISGLVSGSYLIGIDGYGVVPSFWPDRLNWQEAEVITLMSAHQILNNGGAITQDYGTPGFSISGRIGGPDGPLGGARVYAISLENGKIAYAYSNPSGSYEVSTGLQEGRYSVLADLYGYNAAYYGSTIELELIHNPHVGGVDILLSPAIVGVDDQNILPQTIELVGNYPNPFNNTTTILLTAGRHFDSQIEIYNIVGQLIDAIPVAVNPGLNRINWDCRANGGVTVASGIYFYRLRDLPETRKMILLK